MRVDLVDAIDELWSREYGDVPWVRQPIVLFPSAGRRGRLFQFIVEGGSGALRITPGQRSLADGPFVDLSADLYELSRTPDQLGILLRVDDHQSIDCLRVEQVGDDCGVARMVCLEQDAQQGHWEVIYNSIDRGRQLQSHAQQLINATKVPFKGDLSEFIAHLVEGEHRKAASVFERSKHLRRHQAGLQRLTERFELQINAHGMKRTFKFWRKSEKVAYLQGTSELIQALAGLSVYVCMGFGAVLGYIRDQDLIAHDDDLDVLVAFEMPGVADLAQALVLTEQALRAAGFEVVGHFFSHLWVKTPGGHRADVFVGLVEPGGELSFYPSSRRSLMACDVFPTIEGHLHGVSLPMPADCESYLCKTYGESWRRPDIGFAHPWDRDAYADIAGVRATPATWTRGEMARRMAAR